MFETTTCELRPTAYPYRASGLLFFLTETFDRDGTVSYIERCGHGDVAGGVQVRVNSEQFFIKISMDRV